MNGDTEPTKNKQKIVEAYMHLYRRASARIDDPEKGGIPEDLTEKLIQYDEKRGEKYENTTDNGFLSYLLN